LTAFSWHFNGILTVFYAALVREEVMAEMEHLSQLHAEAGRVILMAWILSKVTISPAVVISPRWTEQIIKYYLIW